MPVKDKEIILGIIEEGREAAQNLDNKKLREKVLQHFMAIEEMANRNSYLKELLSLSKRLAIGVNEALVFRDVEVLNNVEVMVENDISGLSD